MSWRKGEYDKQRVRGRALQRRRAGWFRFHPLCGDRLEGKSAEHSRCVQLGRATPASILDHIVPLAKHGPDVEENWQSLCTSCAAAKDAADRGVKLRPRIGTDGLPDE